MAKGISSNPNNIPEAFRNSYVSANTELDHQAFDPSLSGSTCCTVIFNGTKVLCGNAGDSRAIKVGFPENRQFLDVEALNIDHKPDLPEESERILKAGGRIDAFRDQYNGGEQIGPMRVWLKHQDLPGLAMSRSIGDKVAQSVGVSPIPEVKEFTINPNDRFIVIASDGVWEFLSNEEVARIILPYYEQNAPEAAANALVKASYKKWKQVSLFSLILSGRRSCG